MRITNSIIARQVTRNLQNNLERLSQIQMQLSSTKRFNRPSDNPLDYTQSLNLREVLSTEKRYVRNIERSNNLLSLNDSTLSAVNDAIQRARELAITGLSDTIDETGRQALAEEVDEILQQALDFANTYSGSIYIYSGDKTGTMPFEETTDLQGNRTVAYKGDLNTREYEIGQGVTIPVLLNGVDAFLAEKGTIKAVFEVADTTAALDTQLVASTPTVTSGNFFVNGVQIDVDVTTDSLEDLRDRINDADAQVFASIDNSGRLTFKSLQATDAFLENGTSNILSALRVNMRLEGESVYPPGTVNGATPVGFVPNGFRIILNGETHNVDLSGVNFIGQFGTRINSLGLPIALLVNEDASGLDISATETIDSLEIEEISRVFGTAIGAPGINAGTTLASLGIGTPLGSIEIDNGVETHVVDLSSATDIGQVLQLINDSDAGVVAEINSDTDGIDVYNLNETYGITISEVGAGTTAADLGILGSDTQDTAALFGLSGEGTDLREQSANVFQALIDMSDGLNTGDIDAINQSLEDLNTAFNLNNDNRASVGARVNRLELAETRLADSDLFLTTLLSENEDIDLARTITDLKTQETVMQAALNSGARLLLPSLLDYVPI